MQQYSLSLSDQDDKLVRQSILAPLRTYNQSQAPLASIALLSLQ